MDITSMHNEFKLLMDKAGGAGAPSFLASEIDTFLNAAIERFITKRAFGNNPRRTTFEEDQKRRDDLRNVIENYTTNSFKPNPGSAKPNGIFVNLPEDYRHAINEECVLENRNRVSVKPITYDRYNKMIDDPFNNLTSNSVYRLDYSGNSFELISLDRINSYHLRYIKVPKEVSLSGGHNCLLADHTHREIVRMAVLEALENIESPRYQSSKIELNEIE